MTSNVGLGSSINSIAGGVKELADDFQEAPTLTKGLLTAGAVVGASVLLFSQVRPGWAGLILG